VNRGWNRTRVVALVALFAVVATTPLWAAPAVARFVVDALVLVTVTLLWAALVNAGRVVVLGFHGFAGAGAYALFLQTERLGVNPVVAVVGAGLAAGLIALVSGPLVWRSAPAWVAVTTWVMAEFVAGVFRQTPALGGAEPRPLDGVSALGGVVDGIVSWLAIVVGLGSVAAVYAHQRSRVGLALAADRDDPAVAEALGLPVARGRLLIWLLAAGGVGMASAVAHIDTAVVEQATAFDPLRWTLLPLLLAAVGGLRTIEGPALAAVVYVLLVRMLGGHETALTLAAAVGAVLVLLTTGTRGIWGVVATRLPFELFPTRRWAQTRAAPDAPAGPA
jgi:branched-chain amino acid transport system permease protein